MAEVTEPDALTLKRWLSANAPWLSVNSAWDYVGNWSCVHATELALIERGMADEYGRALWSEVDGVLNDDGYPCIVWEDITTIATAPLDARVRAMAAVIREQEKSK